LNQGGTIREALNTGRIRGILVVLGEANVKRTFFETTLALLEKMIPQKILVLLGGELGANTDLLQKELGRRMNAKLTDDAAEGSQEKVASCTHFGLQEIPRVVGFLKEIGQGRRFDSIPAMIAFPEFSRTSTWATAVTFLSLGFAVQIGSPLPFWGSPLLSDILLKQWPKISGGALLASPSASPSLMQAEEILSFLKTRRVKQV
jgi:hydroxylamine reductase (hybrid-cluster protein)